jgi:uncharacterized membrane-anchored protein YhcB (DUF1043 family)
LDEVSLSDLYKKIKNGIAVFLVIFLLITLPGCNVLRFNDPERKAQKQQEKENKKLKKAYQADVKEHYKIQTRETRKRMNKNLQKVNKDFKRKKSKSKWNCS